MPDYHMKSTMQWEVAMEGEDEGGRALVAPGDTGTGSITVLRSRVDPLGSLTAAARGGRARQTMNKEY